jgi:PHD/YefM family antitoxin component YafN of YafNO toxin-antitoxin module
MVQLKNIHPLSDFLRNAKAHVAHLRENGEPEVLTINGQAELVVLSATAYEKMMEEMETVENLNAIHQGMLEAQRGEGIPGHELIRRLRGGKKIRKSA